MNDGENLLIKLEDHLTDEIHSRYEVSHTNIRIYIIKKKPVQVFEKLEGLPLGSVDISSITLAELAYGGKEECSI